MTEPRTDALRPESLEDFHGQPSLVHDLQIILRAAKERGQTPDHLLFAGPPGLGKTTLSQIIAHELNLPLIVTSGPAIAKPSDVVSILNNMNQSSVIFIDEIHRLDPKAEELLYSAMEDNRLDIVVGEGTNAITIPIDLKPFVLVGATTQAGALSAPLRDRFGFTGRLKLYSNEDLAGIVLRSSKLLELNLEPEAALVISQRATGTPRIANRLLRRVRDWAQVNKIPDIKENVALEALTAFGIDDLGLDPLAREILETLVHQFGGGPVGVTTLATAVNEAVATIEKAYEPNLMSKGLISRTSRGRMATPNTYKHLGLPVPDKISNDSNLNSKGQGELPLELL